MSAVGAGGEANTDAKRADARRREYARVFINTTEIQGIARDAGVDPALVDWNGSPGAVWSSLFTVAGNNRQLESLCERADAAARARIDALRGESIPSALFGGPNRAFTGALAVTGAVALTAFAVSAVRRAIDVATGSLIAAAYLAVAALAAVATWLAFSAPAGGPWRPLWWQRQLRSRVARGTALGANVALALTLAVCALRQVRLDFTCALPERGVRCRGLGDVCGRAIWVRSGASLTCSAEGFDPLAVRASRSAEVELRLRPALRWSCRTLRGPTRSSGGLPGAAPDARFQGYWTWSLRLSGPPASTDSLAVDLRAPAPGVARLVRGRFEVPGLPPSQRAACQREPATSLLLPLSNACRAATGHLLSLHVYDTEATPPAPPTLDAVATLTLTGDLHANEALRCP